MRKNKLRIVVGALIFAVLMIFIAGAIIYLGKKSLDEYKLQITDLEYEIESNKQTVYVASRDIEKGETLLAEVEEGADPSGINVMEQTIYTGLELESYISEEQLGCTSIVDIKENEPIMRNMVTELTVANDTREYEMTVANLMTDQTTNDCVDVRIMFPNGEDFLILSKKPVRNLQLNSCIFYTYLSEEEILRMASATIDAYTITGTRIYTTRYVESNLQEPAVPNYLVKPENIDLINGSKQDPNVVSLEVARETLNLSARMDLEARLGGMTKEQLAAVAQGHALTDTAKNSVLLNHSYSVSGNEPEEETPKEAALDEDADTSESDTAKEAPERVTTDVITRNKETL